MLAVLQQSYAEQSVFIEVERCYQSLLLRFDIGDVLHLQTESLAIINKLDWFTLLIQFYASEQRGMGCYDRFYRSLQFLFIQATVEHI